MSFLKCSDYGEIGCFIEANIDKGISGKDLLHNVREMGYSKKDVVNCIETMKKSFVIFEYEYTLYVTRFMESTLLSYFEDNESLCKETLKTKRVFHPIWNK